MSIPTSLIVVLLVAAWLAVLVPMVAKRREQVPETESDGGTFRVLRRASSLRRRPRFSRPEVDEYADGAEDLVGDEALDEALLDQDGEFEDEFAEVDYTEDAYQETEVTVSADSGTTSRRRSWRRSETVVAVAERPVAADYESAAEYDEADDDQDEYESAQDESAEYEDDSLNYDGPAGLDESQLRPVPRRPGRGGFDPDAAEAARAYRYSRRRRVTVLLLLLTVAFSAAAYLFAPVLWSGTAVFGLLLVAYLVYLRRQVRIENDIRQRRLNRLRRARQIRPEYHVDRVDEPVTGSAFGSSVRGAVAVSQVPPSGYRRGREIVDFEDDDPSFDDLEFYQPISYRRASGQ